MALIDDIAQHLEDEGVGTLGTNIFKSYLPETGTGTIMAVLDTGGTQPDRYLPTYEPTFQIYIRADTYLAGKTTLDQVRAALHQLDNETVGSTYFYFIFAISEGGHMGRSENGHDEFSINFQARTR
ncbi:MAG: minor capsid protein [Bacteroidales bacterium]|jgi:hypothetical protein